MCDQQNAAGRRWRKKLAARLRCRKIGGLACGGMLGGLGIKRKGARSFYKIGETSRLDAEVCVIPEMFVGWRGAEKIEMKQGDALKQEALRGGTLEGYCKRCSET